METKKPSTIIRHTPFTPLSTRPSPLSRTTGLRTDHAHIPSNVDVRGNLQCISHT
jgi:hypothetical protein